MASQINGVHLCMDSIHLCNQRWEFTQIMFALSPECCHSWAALSGTPQRAFICQPLFPSKHAMACSTHLHYIFDTKCSLLLSIDFIIRPFASQCMLLSQKFPVNLLFWCPVISHLFCMYNVINWLHDIQDFLSFIPYGTWLLKNLLILWRWPHSDSFNFFQPPHSLPPISPAYPLLWHHPDAPPHVWIPRLSERLALASWWLLWYFSWVHSLVWLKSYFCLIQCGQAITACSDFLWLCHSIHRGWRWAALLCISQPPRARTGITMWWRQSFPSSITTTVEEVPTKDQSLNAIAAPSLRASATVSHPCPSGHPDGNKKSREALHGFKSIPSRSIIIELSDSLHCPKHIVTPKL